MLCLDMLEICNSCSSANESCLKELERKNSALSLPLPKKAPLTASSGPRLVATISQHRLECKQLQERITQMEKEISTYGVKLSDGLEKDISTIISQNSLECSPHMKLFWEQQKNILLQILKEGGTTHIL